MDYQKCIWILGEQFYYERNKCEETFCKLKNKYPLMYRKDKSFADVRSAWLKVKSQRNKPDYVPMGVADEISLFNKYLLDILKKDYNFEKSTYSRDFGVGDVVKIVDVPPQGSAYINEMSEWLGTYMTIKEQQNRCFLMKEDSGKWAWTPSLIEKVIKKR